MGFAVFLSFSFVLVTRKLCEWWQKQVVAEATRHYKYVAQQKKLIHLVYKVSNRLTALPWSV